MAADSPTRRLADDLVTLLLDADPLAGGSLGLREYDGRLPDPSAEAEQRLVGDLVGIAQRANAIAGTDTAGIDTAGSDTAGSDAATLDAVLGWVERSRRTLDMGLDEFSASAMPFLGPPMLFAELARSSLADPRAAADYLERVRGSAGWITGVTGRLRAGAARGLLPVASLLADAVAWAERALAEGAPSAVTGPAAPTGWDGASTWRTEVDRVAREEIAPALAAWRDLLLELRPRARGDDDAGLGAVPGGDEIYAHAIAAHTTLPFTAEELHRIGLDEVARLEARARELGTQVGLTDLDAVRAASRASSSVPDPSAALAAAQAAVRRAEERAAEIMPAPLPGPCAVSPMPPTVAESGMAPHYTRPRDDGSRPGTYWFNTLLPTAGTGWDLEAVAFHETVPGHHSQLGRLQRLTDLPLLQQLSVTVHTEGWGLYAERLAGEFGLYSSVQGEIGAVYVEMHRAARLVVDTGLHAMGWSRQRARDYLLEHVALSADFLTHEIDRYIVRPGQALAYMVGQREILRLRERALAALGARFDLPAFNAAILDDGNLPMPALERSVDRWIAAHGGAAESRP